MAELIGEDVRRSDENNVALVDYPSNCLRAVDEIIARASTNSVFANGERSNRPSPQTEPAKSHGSSEEDSVVFKFNGVFDDSWKLLLRGISTSSVDFLRTCIRISTKEIVVTHPRFLDAIYLLRSELEVLFDHFPKLPPTLAISDCVGFLESCLAWPVEKFISFTKYHTACPMALFLRNEPPSNPSFEFFPRPLSCLIWRGKVKQILRSRLASVTIKNLHLWNSYLQGIKRGCKQVDESFVLQSLKDHIDVLSSDPPPVTLAWHRLPSLLSKIFPAKLSYRKETFLNLSRRLRLASTLVSSSRVVELSSIRSLDRSLPEPSRSAAYELNRSLGGARQHIKKELQLDQGLPIESSIGLLFDKKTDKKSRLTTFKPVFKSDFSLGHGLHSIKETSPGVVENVYSSTPRVRRVDLERIMVGGFDGVLPDYPSWAQEIGHAAVSAVLEPLKVRLITKSESFETYLTRFLQKDLWSLVSSLPQFVLTSRPLSQVDFYDMLDCEKNAFLPDGKSLYGRFKEDNDGKEPQWVSGDYKSATDLLNLNLTKFIFETYLEHLNLSPLERSNARRNLYEQMILYPKRYSGDLYSYLLEKYDPSDPMVSELDESKVFIRQKTGQLMGSILSFPILCLANLLCYWNALCVYLNDYTVPLSLLPVRINGDDILFRCCPSFYSIWKGEHGIGLANFKLSIGKNYIHDSVFTINSECWVFSLLNGKPNFRPITYTNVGLLMGQSKIADRIDTDHIKDQKKNGPKQLVAKGRPSDTGSKPISDQYNLVIHTSMDPLRSHKRYLHYHMAEIKSITGSTKFGKSFFNLFLSPWFQGLGFKPPIGLDVYKTITMTQRRLASVLLSRLQGYVSQPHIINRRQISDIFQKLSFVDSSKSSVKYPSFSPNGITLRLLNTATDVLEPGWEPFADQTETPLLFDVNLGSETTDYLLAQLSIKQARGLAKINVPIVFDNSRLVNYSPKLFYQRVKHTCSIQSDSIAKSHPDIRDEICEGVMGSKVSKSQCVNRGELSEEEISSSISTVLSLIESSRKAIQTTRKHQADLEELTKLLDLALASHDV